MNQYPRLRIDEVMISAPGSASADYEPSDADYRGNRKTKQRYAYSEDSRAAFIELSPPNMTVNEFKTRLENTRGVVGVRLHPKGTKTQQNNVGKHYQEHNFMVNSHVHPGKDMEFELSTHNQLNDGTRPKTVTALFKQTSQVVFLEAYRILVEACKGKELLPDMIVNQHQEARERYRDCSVELSGADGSQALPAPIDEPVIIDASEDDMSGAEESQALPASLDEPVIINDAVETKQQGTNAALQAQIDTLKLRNAKLESSLAHVLACGAVLAVLAVLATVKRQ